MSEPEDRSFYPDYLIEVLTVLTVVVLCTIAAALMFPKELGREINFTTPFKPTAEWYFYWLFELLKYFPGRSAFFGAVVLPSAFAGTLIMVPFISKLKNGRRKAVAAIGILYGSFILFTSLSILTR
ncbi:hypothetical protein [Candidatus Magnetomonas plexicatena]|uniref:hypothetical protein n=1 Tax=Candidatus Magnetomonas plexicatena TaxID=2552947 RepID=UPI001C756132|nr:hypothetical protein E2O03_000775 [Nitrospirales bacterium LBB_01]